MLLEAREGRGKQGLVDVGRGDWLAVSGLGGPTGPSGHDGPCCLKCHYSGTMCPSPIPRGVRKIPGRR